MPGEGPENPMPVGEAHVVGGWDIAVRPQGADGTVGMFADPDGTLLAAVGVTARWVRSEAGTVGTPVLSDEVRFLALNADGSEVAAETER